MSFPEFFLQMAVILVMIMAPGLALTRNYAAITSDLKNRKFFFLQGFNYQCPRSELKLNSFLSCLYFTSKFEVPQWLYKFSRLYSFGVPWATGHVFSSHLPSLTTFFQVNRAEHQNL